FTRSITCRRSASMSWLPGVVRGPRAPVVRDALGLSHETLCTPLTHLSSALSGKRAPSRSLSKDLISLAAGLLPRVPPWLYPFLSPRHSLTHRITHETVCPAGRTECRLRSGEPTILRQRV